ALSYLVLGRPLATNGEDNNMMAQAALALGLAGSSSTAGKLASGLGIKDFDLDTSGSGDSTAVVASGKITDKLSLRYGGEGITDNKVMPSSRSSGRFVVNFLSFPQPQNKDSAHGSSDS
nr:hypothetical protein [Tanacetum cinerariifolium]